MRRLLLALAICVGCSHSGRPSPRDAGRLPDGGELPTNDAGGLPLPPANAGFDYQLGGAYPPPTGVTIVERDRTASPASGLYSICYINGFQIQTEDESFFMTMHPDLILRDSGGNPVIDPDWNEMLVDTRTDAKRQELAAIVGSRIAGCHASGFDAIEIDNLDSYTRSMGLLDANEAVTTMRLFADGAHALGMPIAQKNTTDLVPRRADMGTDFAIAEQCNQYSECDAYTAGYGSSVLVVEYSRAAFDTGCAAYPELSIVLRDVNLVAAGQPGYVYDGC